VIQYVTTAPPDASWSDVIVYRPPPEPWRPWYVRPFAWWWRIVRRHMGLSRDGDSE
jgi:hypothetical protein